MLHSLYVHIDWLLDVVKTRETPFAFARHGLENMQPHIMTTSTNGDPKRRRALPRRGSRLCHAARECPQEISLRTICLPLLSLNYQETVRN